MALQRENPENRKLAVVLFKKFRKLLDIAKQPGVKTFSDDAKHLAFCATPSKLTSWQTLCGRIESMSTSKPTATAKPKLKPEPKSPKYLDVQLEALLFEIEKSLRTLPTAKTNKSFSATCAAESAPPNSTFSMFWTAMGPIIKIQEKTSWTPPMPPPIRHSISALKICTKAFFAMPRRLKKPAPRNWKKQFD
jgi:hypothetical protein